MNPIIYQGTSSFYTGSTSFGFYDNDIQFQTDADRVVKFVASRLGWPIVDLELIPEQIYSCFEEAITSYGNEVYSYLVRDNFLSLEGYQTTSSISLNNSMVLPNIQPLINLTKIYGSEAGVGGNIDWKTGYIDLTPDFQIYDLDIWRQTQGISSSIEIKRVFYEDKPSVNQYINTFTAGIGATSFESGIFGPASVYLLMPINYDMQILQQIEFSNMLRRSNYSFEIINNKLRVFPIPNGDVDRLFFQYIEIDDRYNNSIINAPSGSSQVTNISNTPYTNPIYSDINAIGRQWIFEFTLILAKETLGLIRGKYSQIPIPGKEVTLNQADLISSYTNEKQQMLERLRLLLDEMSKSKLLERKAQETENRMKELNNIPMLIYIG